MCLVDEPDAPLHGFSDAIKAAAKGKAGQSERVEDEVERDKPYKVEIPIVMQGPVIEAPSKTHSKNQPAQAVTEGIDYALMAEAAVTELVKRLSTQEK